jgi:hypothetical protein
VAVSTVTRAQPAAVDGTPTRLLSRPLAVTFLAEFTSLTSFFLLLSVPPMLAAAAGAGSSGAGLITGSLLLGTVAAEAAAAPGIRRFGYRTVRRPRRLPGDVRPDRHLGAGSSPGSPAEAPPATPPEHGGHHGDAFLSR